MTRKAKVHSTTAQVVQINRLLETHLKRDGEYVYYESGWDDDKVARETATTEHPITATHVSNVRRELFGNFKVPDRNPLETKVALLENDVLALKAGLQALAGLHEKLCLNLAMNKIADVKHLAHPVEAPR